MGSSHSIDSEKKYLILFDGVCNLCNGAVHFVINRDVHKRFRFASLQSDTGKAVLRQFGLPTDKVYSIVLVKDSIAMERSNAALEIARHLRGGWPILYLFKIIPQFIRDWIYDIIARYRYAWFGKRDECILPTPELRSRFLD